MRCMSVCARACVCESVYLGVPCMVLRETLKFCVHFPLNVLKNERKCWVNQKCIKIPCKQEIWIELAIMGGGETSVVVCEGIVRAWAENIHHYRYLWKSDFCLLVLFSSCLFSFFICFSFLLIVFHTSFDVFSFDRSLKRYKIMINLFHVLSSMKTVFWPTWMLIN